MNQTINLLTEREVAAMLRIGIDGIRGLRRQGKIPVVKLGFRSLRYNPDEVAKALEKLTSKGAE